MRNFSTGQVISNCTRTNFCNFHYIGHPFTYALGHSVGEIARLTDHVRKTIQNYLCPDCTLINGHYDNRIPGKLAPYETYVIEMRAKGNTYKEIHEHIVEKGYSGNM